MFSSTGFLKVAYHKKEQTGSTNSFELRLWDSRLGRWMSPDPYGQYHSPYLGMGNNPISNVDPDGGCTNKSGRPCEFSVLTGEATDSQGNTWTKDFGSGDLNLITPQQLGEVILVGSGEFNESHSIGDVWDSFWNSRLRRMYTGDMIQFSVGWDASAFLGGGTTLEFNWMLTGDEASFYPYLGYSAHGTVSNGGNLSVDFGFNKAYHSGGVDDVTVSSLPGWEFGGSVGGKIIAGADIGYSYSKDLNYGWHKFNTSVGVGLELSPYTAVNVRGNAEYNFFQFHTGSGKMYFNE